MEMIRIETITLVEELPLHWKPPPPDLKASAGPDHVRRAAGTRNEFRILASIRKYSVGWVTTSHPPKRTLPCIIPSSYVASPPPLPLVDPDVRSPLVKRRTGGKEDGSNDRWLA